VSKRRRILTNVQAGTQLKAVSPMVKSNEPRAKERKIQAEQAQLQEQRRGGLHLMKTSSLASRRELCQ
jgi:hypothetical protein